MLGPYRPAVIPNNQILPPDPERKANSVPNNEKIKSKMTILKDVIGGVVKPSICSLSAGTYPAGGMSRSGLMEAFAV